MVYDIELRPASKSGYDTPDEGRRRYGRYDRSGITIHWWNSPDKAGTHDQTVNYILGQAKAGNMSVNFVASNDKITQLVAPENVSWGSMGGNATTINIELDPRLSGEGYKKVGWLIEQLEKRFGRELPLYPHKHWMKTACPGTLDLKRLRDEADKWQNGGYTPKAVVRPYRIEEITEKKIVINKPTRKWGMNYDNFTAINANPEGSAGQNEIKTVRAICHHNIGYKYYLENPNIPSGYNVDDCDDVPVVIVAPTPPVPSASKIVAPVPLPHNAAKYTILVTIPGYVTSNMAVNRKDPRALIEPGNYFVYNEHHGMKNLTREAGKPGSWINPADNVKPAPAPIPVPAPIEESIPVIVNPPLPTPVPEVPTITPEPVVEKPKPAPKPTPKVEVVDNSWKKMTPLLPRGLDGKLQTVKYKAINGQSIPIYNLDGNKRFLDNMHPGMDLTLVGTFEFNGRLYGRTESAIEHGIWPGIPMGFVRVNYRAMIMNKLSRMIDGIYK